VRRLHRHIGEVDSLRHQKPADYDVDELVSATQFCCYLIEWRRSKLFQTRQEIPSSRLRNPIVRVNLPTCEAPTYLRRCIVAAHSKFKERIVAVAAAEDDFDTAVSHGRLRRRPTTRRKVMLDP
jgi:hypothetical protein